MSKLPWLKFDLDDWNNDPELQQCSLSSQAVLIKLMGVMSRSKTVGNLEINGSYPSLKTLSRAVKVHHKTLKTSLKELQENGVLKNDGLVWYSARMRSDWEKYEKSKADGSRGGNPSLVKGGVEKPVKAELELEEELEEEEEGQPLSPEVEKLTKSTVGIKGWKFTKAEDKDFFTHLLADFPATLISSVLEDLRTYQEKPTKQYKNLHSALRNWCKREKERQLPEDGEQKPQAPLDANGNPLMEIDGEQLTQHEFDRLRGAGEVIRKGDKWIRK